MIYCQKCGTENVDSATFCKKCGESTKTVELKKTSRTVELVLGIIGGIFGLLGGVFALIFSAFAPSVGGLGASAVLASIVGIVGAAYVMQNAKWGGIILIVSAVWLLISISAFGVPGAVLLGLGGLLAVVRK
jgi:ribosomal protein L40E